MTETIANMAGASFSYKVRFGRGKRKGGGTWILDEPSGREVPRPGRQARHAEHEALALDPKPFL